MYLSDLTFIEEGTPNFTDNGLLNFAKMRMVSQSSSVAGGKINCKRDFFLGQKYEREWRTSLTLGRRSPCMLGLHLKTRRLTTWKGGEGLKKAKERVSIYEISRSSSYMPLFRNVILDEIACKNVFYAAFFFPFSRFRSLTSSAKSACSNKRPTRSDTTPERPITSSTR